MMTMTTKLVIKKIVRTKILRKMTGETSEVRFDKRKPREDRERRERKEKNRE